MCCSTAASGILDPSWPISRSDGPCPSGSRAPPAVRLFISYKIQKCQRGPENYAPNQDVNPLLSVTKQECKEVAFDIMKFDGKSGIIALKHRPMYCTCQPADDDDENDAGFWLSSVKSSDNVLSLKN